MSRITTAVLLTTLAAATPAVISAQGRDRGIVEVDAPARGMRTGLFVSGGIGAGREQYSYSDQPNVNSDPLWKPTVNFIIGGSPSANLRLGAEYFGWYNSVTDGTEAFHQFMLSAQLYPDRRAGLFVKAAGGLASSGEYYSDGASLFETGFGWTVGVGYDIPIARTVSLTPTVSYASGSFAERGNPTINEHVLNIGASFTFQSRRHGRR